MKTKHVEAKILKHDGEATNLLIRVGDCVVQAKYSELDRCEFPVWTDAPIYVQIPPQGVKHHVAGLSSDEAARKTADGGLADIIKFPIFAQQSSSTVEAFDDLPHSSLRGGANNVLAREPLAAIGVSASALMADNRRVETHCVMPIWTDGTAVLVTLNWCEGEAAEGTPNPEWYLNASQGMPLEMAIRRLQESELCPANAESCRYRINVSPWRLGAAILENSGQELGHKIWQRVWQYSEYEEFQIAIGQLRNALLDAGIPESSPMAQQRA